MWCTRWYLPLLLLPLPTAPPYFLYLFLISLTLHARPCFYCVVLLVTLFISSCYWQPFPLSASLSSPWNENVTTFGQALNYSLPENYTGIIPPIVAVIDRCWCEISTGAALFEPFNISAWEKASVEKLARELINKEKSKDTSPTSDPSGSNTSMVPSATDLRTEDIQPPKSNNWSLFSRIGRSRKEPVETPSPSSELKNLSRSRPWQYDLRPYGFDIIVDFRWTRG